MGDYMLCEGLNLTNHNSWKLGVFGRKLGGGGGGKSHSTDACYFDTY